MQVDVCVSASTMIAALKGHGLISAGMAQDAERAAGGRNPGLWVNGRSDGELSEKAIDEITDALEAISSGDMALARTLLGRNFSDKAMVRFDRALRA